MFIPYSLMFTILGIFMLTSAMFTIGARLAKDSSNMPAVVAVATIVLALLFLGMAAGSSFMVEHFEGVAAMTLILAPDGSLQTPEDTRNYDTD